MSVEAKLRDEIISSIEVLSDMELGGEDYTKSAESIVKLTDRMVELKKVEQEVELKKEEQLLREQQIKNELELKKEENTLKEQQLNDENKDRKWKNGIAIAGVAVPVVVTIWGTIKTLKFETEGTVTSLIGRGFIGKLLPKK